MDFARLTMGDDVDSVPFGSGLQNVGDCLNAVGVLIEYQDFEVRVLRIEFRLEFLQ